MATPEQDVEKLVFNILLGLSFSPSGGEDGGKQPLFFTASTKTNVPAARGSPLINTG
jgi:hypothetical protein